jgi:hypothetical protein
MPAGITAENINVRWFGQVPVVVAEKNGNVSHVFNPDSHAFVNLAELRNAQELANADPNAKETWPSWAQEYFADPDNATNAQDERFDQFLTDSRRSYLERLGQSDPERLRTLLDFLVQGGVLTEASREDVAGMTQSDMLATLQSMYDTDQSRDFLPRRHMLWMNLINNAIEKRTTILSPNEIRQITIDREAYVEPWINRTPEDWPFQYGYGFGGGIIPIDEAPRFRGKDGMYEELPKDIFGKESDDYLLIVGYGGLYGDIAGLVELPRRSGYAMLTRVRSDQGQPFLHIFHLEEEGLSTSSGSKLCFGSLSLEAGERGNDRAWECPADLQGEVSQYYDWSQGEWQTLTQEAVLEWLMWPPAYADHEQRRVLSQTRVLEFIVHPRSHLIMASRLKFWPPDMRQNPP